MVTEELDVRLPSSSVLFLKPPTALRTLLNGTQKMGTDRSSQRSFLPPTVSFRTELYPAELSSAQTLVAFPLVEKATKWTPAGLLAKPELESTF